jgi:hypothetical protein
VHFITVGYGIHSPKVIPNLIESLSWYMTGIRLPKAASGLGMTVP